MTNDPSVDAVMLFIDIMCGLLEETIKFPRTKELPLICSACFVRHNKFKDFCVQFLEHFGNGILYELPVTTTTEKVNGKPITKYICDKSRAKKQRESYLQCLHRLKSQLHQSNHEKVQQKTRHLRAWIENTKSQRFRFSNNTNNINNPLNELIETELECVICYDNRSNIVTKGCEHCVMCDQCEQQSQPKVCPRCQVSYSDVTKLQL